MDETQEEPAWTQETPEASAVVLQMHYQFAL